MARRAIGIVRVSQVAGREGESFVSPAEQRSRIEAACERDGLTLLRTIDELDVSGGTPLERRAGLRGAVEAVEAGEAEVIVAAYFDRLVRSLRVQEEVVSRVEAVGGGVMAVDIGAVSGETASQWVVGTFLGAVAEYQRRATKERAGAAQARAVARGVAPWPNVPPGYVRGEDGILAPSSDASTVAKAFAMRADGHTIAEVRTFLAERGIDRSYHGVQSMLTSRVYLGEIHFGALVNVEAHEGIVSPDVWQAAQRPPRGTRPPSERLLARLGVLRCGTCGARMVVGSAHGGQYAFYRCPPTGDCPRRFTISAAFAEQALTDRVREALRDMEGRASAEREATQAAERAEKAQADLDAAIRAFTGLEGEAVARERLAELRQARDDAVGEVHRLGSLRSAFVVRADADWDKLSLTAQRELIRAVIDRAEVGPGRGPDRITIHLAQ